VVEELSQLEKQVALCKEQVSNTKRSVALVYKSEVLVRGVEVK